MAKCIPRVLISATGSNCGKTLITSGLLYLLKHRMEGIHAFKCGPDYIDPMYHRSVLGIPSKNLDPYFCDEELLRSTFAEDAGSFNIIEGAMGLMDGMGVTSDYGTMDVARKLKCPVILTVNCDGMGAGILAVINGFVSYDADQLIKGIILNRISTGFFDRIKPEVEERFGIKVVGHLPKLDSLKLDSRHLGLKFPDENDAISQISEITELISENFDIDGILEIGREAGDLGTVIPLKDRVKVNLTGLTIGIAKDSAFSFYYGDNLKALKLAGAELKFFSPMHDTEIDGNIDAVYMGGGYPENYLEELSANTSFKTSLRAFVDSGKPLLAECGAYMYLQHDIEGYEMAGIFGGSAVNTGKLVRFGYIDAAYKDYHLKGHEFHYYDVADSGSEFSIIRAANGREYKAVQRYKRCLAGFPHFYFLSDPDFLNEFKLR